MAVPLNGRNDNTNGQLIFLCKDEIAGVVGWYAHHSAGAVGGEHVISDIDWDALTVNSVYGITAGKHASLLFVAGEPVDL